MITLAQLEQEVARRVGPYYRFFADRQVPSTATFDYVNVPELRTNADLDLVTNLWLLRRGQCYGEPDEIVSMDPLDRQRTVSTYQAQAGRVFPDRPWATIPESGEYLEFHHFNPDQELRPAVLAGLARCYMSDIVQAVPTQQFGGIDLTVQFPWLTEPWQVDRVQYGWWSPFGDAPFHCIQQRGHLYLMGATGVWSPITVWVTAWRPVASWVNETDSETGPTDDFDTLNVDLAYAAAASHIEAWHLFPSRMQHAAAQGLQASQEMTANEFTRQAVMHGPVRSGRIAFGDAFGLGSGQGVVVNI